MSLIKSTLVIFIYCITGIGLILFFEYFINIKVLSSDPCADPSFSNSNPQTCFNKADLSEITLVLTKQQKLSLNKGIHQPIVLKSKKTIHFGRVKLDGYSRLIEYINGESKPIYNINLLNSSPTIGGLKSFKLYPFKLNEYVSYQVLLQLGLITYNTKIVELSLNNESSLYLLVTNQILTNAPSKKAAQDTLNATAYSTMSFALNGKYGLFQDFNFKEDYLVKLIQGIFLIGATDNFIGHENSNTKIYRFDNYHYPVIFDFDNSFERECTNDFNLNGFTSSTAHLFYQELIKKYQINLGSNLPSTKDIISYFNLIQSKLEHFKHKIDLEKLNSYKSSSICHLKVLKSLSPI